MIAAMPERKMAERGFEELLLGPHVASEDRERSRDAARYDARKLQIPEWMVKALLLDPVMGIYVTMGIKFDAFQAALMRMYWWCPRLIDSSGLGTFKSGRVWAFLNYRAMMMPERQCMALYQTLQAGKDIFWKNYDNFRHPIFQSQLGRRTFEGGDESKGLNNVKGPACFTQYYRNGAALLMPAPSWLQEAVGQAGKTVNDIGVDEWTKIEVMGKKDGTKGNAALAGGIDTQIIGRARGPTFNQFHPVWANHIIFTATAEHKGHPAWKRVAAYQREIESGNPDYALVTSSYKDFSMLPDEKGQPFRESKLNWKMIHDLRTNSTEAHFRREALGLWADETLGWYSEEAIQRCMAIAVALGVEVETERMKGENEG